ncbi:MAG: hypothetical protein ACK5A3_23985, partial [Planctomyces sp.]
MQPCDQLLVAVAAFGQWPAPALRDLSLWAINRFGRMGWPLTKRGDCDQQLIARLHAINTPGDPSQLAGPS